MNIATSLDGALSRALASGNSYRVLDVLTTMGLSQGRARGAAFHALTTSCPDWLPRHERWLQEREFISLTETMLELPDA